MKHLIVLFDGTWNDLSMQFVTNVARFGIALEDTDKTGNPQVIEYVSGLGTNHGTDKLTGGALGHGIDQKVTQGYTFLVNNYEPNDKIYIVGFSRGAYTARSLTGMLAACGLLKRNSLDKIGAAYSVYRHGKQKARDQFKKQHESFGNVDVDLLACWDTVASLGVPDRFESLPIDRWINEKYQFHANNNLCANVKNAIHAIALDEKREEFDIELMKQNPKAPGQKLIQTWFPGDHGCVGGGSWYKRGLSNIALEWMIETTTKTLKLPLAFDPDRISDVGPKGTVFDDKTDPIIFFDNEVKPPYEKMDSGRKVPANAVFHASVIERKSVLGDLYPLPTPVFNKLKRHGADKQKTLRNTFLVIADQENDTGREIVAGQRYKVTIKDTQVWKDGDLDPCRVTGWHTTDLDESDTWYNPFDSIKKTIVRIGESARILSEKPWFSLVLKVGGDVQSITDQTEYVTFDESGRLWACANDMRLAFGNNQGWLVVKLEKAD